jgi:hypothetical protein
MALLNARRMRAEVRQAQGQTAGLAALRTVARVALVEAVDGMLLDGRRKSVPLT